MHTNIFWRQNQIWPADKSPSTSSWYEVDNHLPLLLSHKISSPSSSWNTYSVLTVPYKYLRWTLFLLWLFQVLLWESGRYSFSIRSWNSSCFYKAPPTTFFDLFFSWFVLELKLCVYMIMKKVDLYGLYIKSKKVGEEGRYV